ncbi:beta strand repeat-containing protein, partial [Vreelandella andesensis]|uniref:beta strand repeat-containing protein n=1 Tax=Vreelandella andesensis TaxID=447567 RepID=UPI00142D1F0A
YVTEADAITIGEVAAITTNRVLTDGTVTESSQTDAAQSDLASDGQLVLQTTAGNIETLAAGGSVTAAGNLLLKAGGATSDIILGATVTSSGGHISLDAGQGIAQNATIETQTDGKTIDLRAVGVITMDDGAQTITNNGNIRYMAKPAGVANADNVITLGGLDAGTGNISLVAGSILDGGDTHTDIIADQLRLNATLGIGSDGTDVNAIDTQINTLSASSRANGVFINETDALVIDAVDAITVNTVAADASVSGTTDNLQEDVNTINDGSVVIEADDIRVNQGATTSNSRAIYAIGTGHILLNARDGSLTLQGQVLGDDGHVTLLALSDLEMRGIAGIVSTSSTSIYAKAGGDLAMADGAMVTSGGGHVRFEAGANINLGLINAGSGNVALISGGAVLDNQTPVTGANVFAAGLLIDADAGIASSGNRLETSVTTLSVNSAAGNIFLHDTGSVAIGQVTTTVQEVGNTADLTIVEGTQSDVTTVAGDITLSAATDLTLNDGDENGKSVASISGNITVAAGRHLNLQPSGSIVTSGGNLDLDSVGNTTLSGTVDVAGISDLTVGGALVITGDYTGGGSVTIEVAGTTTINSTFSVGDEDANTESSFTLIGDGAIVLGNDVASDIIFTTAGNTTVDGGADVTASGLLTVGGNLNLDSVGSTALNGTVNVAGISDLNIGEDLAITGSYTGGNNVTLMVAGITDLDGMLDVTNDLQIDGTDAITLADSVTVSGNATINGGSSVNVDGT